MHLSLCTFLPRKRGFSTRMTYLDNDLHGGLCEQSHAGRSELRARRCLVG